MKILGIDSSGLVASVALVCDGVLVGEYTIQNKQTHSQTLLPMLDAMMKMAGVEIEEVDAIAVASGPGSFTGLRIGAATAKGLAGALHKPIVAVPTLEGLAYNCSLQDKLICPLMDARRKQAYYGIYSWEEDGLKTVSQPAAEPIESIIEKINKIGKNILFLGDGVSVFKETIDETVCVPYSFATTQNNWQRAGSIAALGEVYAAREDTMEPAAFAPVYLRLSQAERERKEREDGKLFN